MSKGCNVWEKTGRKPTKIVSTVRRQCRKNNFDLDERTTGGHWIGTVHGKETGTLIVSTHVKEVPKGTFKSLMEVLIKVGLAVSFIVVPLYLLLHIT